MTANRREGEDQAIVAARRLDFPFYFPGQRSKFGIAQPVRTYRLRDSDGRRHGAYRLVVRYDQIHYYGIQGTSWRDPPILDDPHATIRRGGRKLLVYRDGRAVRLVAWRTRKASYWVANTLTRSLSSDQMIRIAGALRRFG